MLSDQARDALLNLHRRAGSTSDLYVLDRIDRALDEISRNFGNDRPAAFQIRSSYANAAKVIAGRRAIAPTGSLDDGPGAAPAEPGKDEAGYAVVDMIDWVLTSPALTAPERRLILDLCEGEDAPSLALKHGIPVARIRERISRARKTARAAYRQEVLAA